MKVEIWSDVMCPFCYIGKRKFENALEQFAHKEDVEVVWKSFQLDPNLKTDPKATVTQRLMDKKGWSMEYAKEMNEHVTKIAKAVGLTYNLNEAVVANSFDAHRFSHLAKKHNLQDAAEERLFSAYFTEGKNTADKNTIIQLGIDIGLDSVEVKQMIESDEFAKEVQNDLQEAEQVGVSGVPFFLINEKYTISGAEESSTFLQALNTIWKEFENK